MYLFLDSSKQLSPFHFFFVGVKFIFRLINLLMEVFFHFATSSFTLGRNQPCKYVEYRVKFFSFGVLIVHDGTGERLTQSANVPWYLRTACRTRSNTPTCLWWCWVHQYNGKFYLVVYWNSIFSSSSLFEIIQFLEMAKKCTEDFGHAVWRGWMDNLRLMMHWNVIQRHNPLINEKERDFLFYIQPPCV